MSAAERQLADDPVLVDQAEACTILGVSDTTFARLCREGRFADWGGPGLFRSVELRRYRAQDKPLGASAKSVTNAKLEPSKSATEARTQPTPLAQRTRNDLGPELRGLWARISASPLRCTHLLADLSETSGPAPAAGSGMILEQHDPRLAADDDDSELPDPPAGLSEVDFRGCRWIDGEPAPLRPGIFCGKPTRPGTSWCPEHYRIAFARAACRRDAA